MKPSLAIITFVALAAARPQAQNPQSFLQTLPECAQGCLSDSVMSSTDCAITDAKCFCDEENYKKIYSGALTCVLGGCGAPKALSDVVPQAEAYCLAVNGGSPTKPSSAAAAPAVSAAAIPTPPPHAPYVPISGAGAASFASGSYATVIPGPSNTVVPYRPTTTAPLQQSTNAAAPTGNSRSFAALAAVMAVGAAVL